MWSNGFCLRRLNGDACGKLGGFHFNDSKYGDDDLDSGSINPYQLFLVFNELVAYTNLAQQQGTLSPKAEMIATYALCGFANLSSIAIQIGGIGGLAPERKHDLAKLGLRAVVAGSRASFMTASLVGILR